MFAVTHLHIMRKLVRITTVINKRVVRSVKPMAKLYWTETFAGSYIIITDDVIITSTHGVTYFTILLVIINDII